MIALSEAEEIAKQYLESHYPNILDEGVLASSYYDPECKLFVFRWSHEKGILYSETDRAVIWISETGEILKIFITWTPFEPSLLALSHDDCIRMEERVRTVTANLPASFEIIGYRHIKKLMYFSYSDEPLKDWYWIGVLGNDRYLIDENGHIIGQHIPLPAESFSLSGIWGCIDGNNTLFEKCWEQNRKIANEYFSRWFPDTSICLTLPSSSYGVKQLYENPELKVLFINSHGDPYGTWVSRNSYSKECESVPEDWGIYSYPVEQIQEDDFDIRTVFADRSKPVSLAILYHCGAMDSKGVGTFEYEYRKGSNIDTVVIGLKHTTDESFSVADNFLESFLSSIDNDWDKSLYSAYLEALNIYDEIKDHIDFSGDTTLTLRKIGPTITPTPTPTATPTPVPTPKFEFDTAPVIFYDGVFYKLGETINAYAGDELIAYTTINEVNGASGNSIFRVDNYGTDETLCLDWESFSGYDTHSMTCAFDMITESAFVVFRACHGDTVTDEAGWVFLSLQTPTPTPTSTPTATPTATPTPTITPAPTPTPPPVLGECIFPRIVTGTSTPRMEKGIPFYRVKCIIDKWG